MTTKYLEAPTNKLFGKWEVLGYSHYDNEHYWKVLCTSCKKEFSRRAGQLVLGRSHGCQSCNAFEREKYSFWEGIDGISIQYISKLKWRRKEISITLQDIVNQWKLQKGLCAYSKIQLSVAARDKKWAESTASIDRVDSSKGYIKGNIQWVHKRINIMKSNMAHIEFLDWIEKIHGGSCGV